jgi:hypothetical protein
MVGSFYLLSILRSLAILNLKSLRELLTAGKPFSVGSSTADAGVPL